VVSDPLGLAPHEVERLEQVGRAVRREERGLGDHLENGAAAWTSYPTCRLGRTRPEGGGCRSSGGRRLAPRVPGTVELVADALALQVAGAWRWGVLVLAAGGGVRCRDRPRHAGGERGRGGRSRSIRVVGVASGGGANLGATNGRGAPHKGGMITARSSCSDGGLPLTTPSDGQPDTPAVD
jgi:hypothetical protein